MTSETDAGGDEGVVEARRLEAVGRLAAGIAHDFNNVLAAIRGHGQIALRSLDALARDGADAAALARVRGDVAAMDESAQRGAALTRQLGLLTRPGGDEPTRVDLGAFASGLHALLRRLVPAQIELALSLTDAPAAAHVSESRLLQATLELVLDARDAIPGAGRIELATAVEHPPQRRAALLVRHSASAERVPTRRTRDLLAALVAGSPDALRLEHSVSGGAVVALFLPAASSSADRSVETQAAERSAPADAGATVLLVEDDTAVRRIARTVLERLGYRVVPAGDGHEALRLVDVLAEDDVVPDLLVTDVTMPAMNGPQLAVELRRRAPGIGVLFMSGMGEPVTVGAPSPREDFLEKPFTLDDLAARVAALLAASGAGEGKGDAES